jgi:hypothetical protein
MLTVDMESQNLARTAHALCDCEADNWENYLLTAEPSLRSWQSFSRSKSNTTFMEHEGLLPWSPGPDTGLYPEPDYSSALLP